MSEPSDFLSQISDNKPVRLFLPVLNSDERLLLQCLLQKSDTNHFLLLFKQNTLPFDKIDMKTTCLINLDVSGQSVSIESKIFEVLNSQTLEMIPEKTINHEQVREYFRVDCTVPVMLKSVVADAFAEEKDTWKILGTTVDLSGSGLRASFPTAPPENTQVRVELALPSGEISVVKALASPVRISQLTETLWDAAYQFDEIEEEDQDAVIGCCLVAQRSLLRLKIQVKGK